MQWIDVLHLQVPVELVQLRSPGQHAQFSYGTLSMFNAFLHVSFFSFGMFSPFHMLQVTGATCGPRRKSSQKPRNGAIPAPAPTMT